MFFLLTASNAHSYKIEYPSDNESILVLIRRNLLYKYRLARVKIAKTKAEKIKAVTPEDMKMVIKYENDKDQMVSH